MPVASTKRRSASVASLTQRLGRLAVEDAPAGDDQGPLSTAQDGDRPVEGGRFGQRPRDVPDPRGEELLIPIVGLGLDVLR
jgi:hypothetical protein